MPNWLWKHWDIKLRNGRIKNIKSKDYYFSTILLQFPCC
jgi:hypothetical protein